MGHYADKTKKQKPPRMNTRAHMQKPNEHTRACKNQIGLKRSLSSPFSQIAQLYSRFKNESKQAYSARGERRGQE